MSSQEKMKLIWTRASWVIRRYQLNMLLEIHKNLGFYTTFSRARLAGPVFVCLLCFFRKNVQLKEVKYTYIYIHIYISPCFPTTNCQQPKKEEKKKNDWQIQWTVGPNAERFWKWMKGFIEPLWDTKIYKNERHIYEETALFGLMESGGIGWGRNIYGNWLSNR